MTRMAQATIAAILLAVVQARVETPDHQLHVRGTADRPAVADEARALINGPLGGPAQVALSELAVSLVFPAPPGSA
jgi:hypothetical protein